jgi:GcrA cell cycle regulator
VLAPVESLSAAIEPRMLLAAIGIPQRRAAQLFNVDARSIRRWQNGDRRVPYGIVLVLHLLAMKAITVDQIEAAVAASVRNGPVGPVESVGLPEQLARAPAEAAAAPSSTTAEKIMALTAATCHWPIGNPGEPGFSFCGAPAVRGEPYCETHCVAAHRTPALLANSGKPKPGRPVGWSPVRQMVLFQS